MAAESDAGEQKETVLVLGAKENIHRGSKHLHSLLQRIKYDRAFITVKCSPFS